MVIVIVEWTVVPARLQELLADLGKNSQRALQSEEGCLSYRFGVIDAATGRVLVAERWRTMGDFDAHRTAPHITALVDHWKTDLVGKFEIYESADT